MFISSSSVISPNGILRSVWSCPRGSEYAEGVLAADDEFMEFSLVCCHLSENSALTFVSSLFLGMNDLLLVVQESKLLPKFFHKNVEDHFLVI